MQAGTTGVVTRKQVKSAFVSLNRRGEGVFYTLPYIRAIYANIIIKSRRKTNGNDNDTENPC